MQVGGGGWSLNRHRGAGRTDGPVDPTNILTRLAAEKRRMGRRRERTMGRTRGWVGMLRGPLAVLVIGLTAAIGGTDSALAADSAYTTHDYEACPLTIDEDAYQVRRCEGFGGIAVN